MSEARSTIPAVVQGLDIDKIERLFRSVEEYISRQSGSAALQLLIAGGLLLRSLASVYDQWLELLRRVADNKLIGTAGLIAFIRATPEFIDAIGRTARRQPRAGGAPDEIARRILSIAIKITEIDVEAALLALRSSGKALATGVLVDQLERWAHAGLSLLAAPSDTKARRSYFAFETRQSNEALRSIGSVMHAGLALDSIAQRLRFYIEGLAGRAIEIASLAEDMRATNRFRIHDGKSIYLPAVVDEFADREHNFRLYKVLAAYAAGQIEFGTHLTGADLHGLRAACLSIAELCRAENPAENNDAHRHTITETLIETCNYQSILALFPHQQLAKRIFVMLENERIDRRLRQTYRGIKRDLDFIRRHLSENRPPILNLEPALLPFEVLVQITLCGGARDDSRYYYSKVVSELETIVAEYIGNGASNSTITVADTLMATSRVYTLFQKVMDAASAHGELQLTEPPLKNRGDHAKRPSDVEEDSKGSEASDTVEEQPAEMLSVRRSDASELFNAWAMSESLDNDPDSLDGSENWVRLESAEQPLGADEAAFFYDEWDRELSDHRVGWSRVIETHAAGGSASFVRQTRERFRGTISSIRHQFQLMRPEKFKRIAGELDGEDFDLNAVIDYVTDRRTSGRQSERIYTRLLRRERSVTVLFLLDQSSSTARTVGQQPLQPYTHPGRRIIEIEKEGLVLMSEALEAAGDAYSIYGFTSEGRHNVRFFCIKDFDEKYSEEIAGRIGGITYQNNTRLGAAIRHATTKLAQQETETKLLVVLSDGRPYDHDYGDARYAREDTLEALGEAKRAGVTPFCITIDRDSEAELRDLYGEVGYIIIDDVLTLPERLPAIYRRLTT